MKTANFTLPHAPSADLGEIDPPTGDAGMRRWINREMGRYYQVELVEDLFGDWTLVQYWGTLGARQGGRRVVWVPSRAAGVKRIEAIGKQRDKRGYQLVGRPWRGSN